MKERPIVFSGPMIRPIVADQKTQTRRVMKPQPVYHDAIDRWIWHRSATHPITMNRNAPYQPELLTHCPYGAVGDRLWVRETWRQGEHGIEYRADSGHDGPMDGRADTESRHWTPSIHMPRWASRITLEITSVRVERVQDISLGDMRAEGVRPTIEASLLWRETLTDNFRDLWNQINEKRGYGWAVNPWVWVIGFRRLSQEKESVRE